jgi:hypothetical protein
MSRSVGFLVLLALGLAVSRPVHAAASQHSRGHVVGKDGKSVFGGQIVFIPDDLSTAPITCQLDAHGGFTSGEILTNVLYNVKFTPGGGGASVQVRDPIQFKSVAELKFKVGGDALTFVESREHPAERCQWALNAGVSKYVSDADYSQDASTGPTVSASLARVINGPWCVVLGAGWSRSGYKNGSQLASSPGLWGRSKDDIEVQLIPVTASIDFVHRSGDWASRFGVGTGIYFQRVLKGGELLGDPNAAFTGAYPGFSGDVGVEHGLGHDSPFAVGISTAVHWVLGGGDFSSFDSFSAPIELRVGISQRFNGF